MIILCSFYYFYSNTHTQKAHIVSICEYIRICIPWKLRNPCVACYTIVDLYNRGRLYVIILLYNEYIISTKLNRVYDIVFTCSATST